MIGTLQAVTAENIPHIAVSNFLSRLRVTSFFTWLCWVDLSVTPMPTRTIRFGWNVIRLDLLAGKVSLTSRIVFRKERMLAFKSRIVGIGTVGDTIIEAQQLLWRVRYLISEIGAGHFGRSWLRTIADPRNSYIIL